LYSLLLNIRLSIGTAAMPIVLCTIQSYNVNPLSFFGFFGILVLIVTQQLSETFQTKTAELVFEMQADEPLLEMTDKQSILRIDKEFTRK